MIEESSTSNWTSEQGIGEKVSYEDYFDPRLPKWLSIVLLVIGLFGNLLSVWVFAQRQMRKHSTFVYLAFLCFVDLYVLLFGLGDVILISHVGLILRNKSLLVCRLHTFFTYTFTHLSSFILASVSIDRAIATNVINFAKSYCKPRVAHRVIFINVILAMTINFHTLVFLGYEDQSASTTNNHTTSGNFYCSSQKDTLYDHFLDPYFQWIDLIFYAILPFITMAICSFFIIRAMFASNRRLKKTMNAKTSNLVSAIKAASFEQNGTNSNNVDLMDPDRQQKTSLLSRMGRRSTTYLVERRRASSAAPLQGRLNKTLHLTYTLISINALFFCLVSPLVILSIIVKGKEDIREYKFIFNIVYLLAYANHSFNFVFYGLSSPPYRECIFELCCSSEFNTRAKLISISQQVPRRSSAAPALAPAASNPNPNLNCSSSNTTTKSILRNCNSVQ